MSALIGIYFGLSCMAIIMLKIIIEDIKQESRDINNLIGHADKIYKFKVNK
jgi:hypothetical protein